MRTSHPDADLACRPRLQGTWSCRSTVGKTKFDDVEFESREWNDYDEDGGQPVGITELEGRWVRA